MVAFIGCIGYRGHREWGETLATHFLGLASSLAVLGGATNSGKLSTEMLNFEVPQQHTFSSPSLPFIKATF